MCAKKFRNDVFNLDYVRMEMNVNNRMYDVSEVF